MNGFHESLLPRSIPEEHKAEIAAWLDKKYFSAEPPSWGNYALVEHVQRVEHSVAQEASLVRSNMARVSKLEELVANLQRQGGTLAARLHSVDKSGPDALDEVVLVSNRLHSIERRLGSLDAQANRAMGVIGPKREGRSSVYCYALSLIYTAICVGSLILALQ